MRRILGIASSCDEMAAAVVRDGREILASVVHGQVEVHAPYGGVVPELASRDHIRKLLPLIQECLDEAGVASQDLDGVAYTAGPGLIGALLVGTAVAVRFEPGPMTSLLIVAGLPLLAFLLIEDHVDRQSRRWQRRTLLELPVVAEQLGQPVVDATSCFRFQIEQMGRDGLLSRDHDFHTRSVIVRKTSRVRNQWPAID